MGNAHLPRSISLALRFEVMKKDGFRCYYCGRRPPEVELEVDHIWPVSLGGETEMMNLTTSCFDCNRGKRDTTPVPLEWSPTYADFKGWAQDAARAQYLGVPIKEIDSTQYLGSVEEARHRLADLSFTRWILLRSSGKIDRAGNYLDSSDEPSPHHG